MHRVAILTLSRQESEIRLKWVPTFSQKGLRLNMFEGLLQPMHLLVILIVAMFAFGPKKLPELGKGLGEGIRGFKKALNETEPEK